MEWDEVLRNLKREEREILKREGVKGRYTKKKISLGTALTDERFKVFGDYLGVAKIVGTSSVTVKLDNRHGVPIDLREVAEIESPFGTLYLTTDGVDPDSYITIYFGGDLTARIKPKESKVSIRNIAGSDVDLATDGRFKSHTGGHVKTTLAVADTAQRMVASTTKIGWALIQVDLPIRWGFSSTVSRGSAIGMIITADNIMTIDYCDLYDAYFVNYNAAETPTVQIEYIEEAS